MEEEEKETFSRWLWDKTRLSFWCVWHEYLFHQTFNWITFNVIQLEIDWDKICGEIDFTFQLLGCGVRWQKRYKPFEDTTVGKISGEYRSSDLVTQQETALKVLEQIEQGASIASLQERYQNMKVTVNSGEE